MTLYKADFLDLISKPAVSKGKGKKKAEPVEEVEESTAPTVAEDKVKKPRTEKQLAALERMKEARKRKREEAEAEKIAEQEAITQKQNEVAAKEKEIAEKKALQAEKRRLKREAKKEVQEATPSNTSAEVDHAIEEVMEEKPKAKKAKKAKTVATNTSNEPPAWFQKYVEGVNKEQNLLNREKKPAKQVKIESQEVAAKSWNDGLTRDRVQQEVDGHMGRMYNMMFGARKLL